LSVDSKVRVGCSGWSYEDWVGPFYPKDSKPKDFLKLYSSVFNTVEIDSSFYRIPNQAMVSQWKKNTPEDFLFCPKFPKKITHDLKLQNVSSILSFFYKTLAGLGDKLGPLVVQLPHSFKYEKGMPSLTNFVSELKSGFRHAIEFRHVSWFRQDVYKLLESKNPESENITRIKVSTDIPEIVTPNGNKLGPLKQNQIIEVEKGSDLDFIIQNRIGEII
jgi:uncharacterized protein YecE (DUF72 family)